METIKIEEMLSMTQEIKPCLYCGETDWNDRTWNKQWVCSKCGARTPLAEFLEEAISAHNAAWERINHKEKNK